MRKIFRRIDWVRPVILLLMICHLGRFYADAPLALAICFEHNHQGPVVHGETEADHHHSHQMEPAATDPDTDSNYDPGFKIEHCRDTYLGMNLIPPSVLSLPAETTVAIPDVSFVTPAYFAANAYQDLALSIFHPPQLS